MMTKTRFLPRPQQMAAALLGVLATLSSAQAQVNVFACEPEWAALTQALGGDQVKITTATTAFQDPHHIEARPSLIASMRRADLVVCTGAELEIGWLPLLLRQSGNRDVQAGTTGYFMAADQVELIEVPTKVDRIEGDVHAAGNPHVHSDPHRLHTIGEALAQRLQTVDPANTQLYQQRWEAFSKDWQAAITRWENTAAPLRGKQVVINHRNFNYLLNWLGMEAVADLEPKPGLPPTSAHLASVLQSIPQQHPIAITLAPYQSDKGAKWLAKRTQLPVLSLPFTIGGAKTADNLQALFDVTLQQLLSALPESGDD